MIPGITPVISKVMNRVARQTSNAMMQSIFSWFKERIFGARSESEFELGQTGVRVRPPSERPQRDHGAVAEKITRKPDLRFESEIGGRIEDAGPGKNVLVRSKYLREDTGTHDALKIIDEDALLESEPDAGIDPYNTGQFDRSKSWNSRFRK